MRTSTSDGPLEILLVEGASALSRRVGKMLVSEQISHNLRTVNTASEALTILRQATSDGEAKTPQLILLGAGTPLDGIFEIANELERNAVLKHAEVLVLANTAPGSGSLVTTGIRDIRSVAPIDLATIIGELQVDSADPAFAQTGG